jgi:seryl-tRNA(Sec) selenium transferase
LRNAGYRLTINDKTDIIVAVATPEKNISIEQIVDWMKENSILVYLITRCASHF